MLVPLYWPLNSIRTNVGFKEIEHRAYPDPISLKKGQHLGGFGMGSSVVLLLDNRFSKKS